MTTSRSGLSIPGYTITIASGGLLRGKSRCRSRESVNAAVAGVVRYRPSVASAHAGAESGLRQVVGLSWTEAARFGGVTLADHPVDREPREWELKGWSIHPLYVSGVRPAQKDADHIRTRKGHHSMCTLLISWRSRGGSGSGVSRGRASGDRGAGDTVAARAGQPDMESVGATE